jgi:Putative regulator of cell autolysis
MAIKKTFFNLLLGRFARNVYFWVFTLYFAFELNANNERSSHSGIINKPEYLYFMFGGTLIHMALVYCNNLVLAPKFLLKRKYTLYFLTAGIWIALISIGYAVFVKYLYQYIDVERLQHPGYVAGFTTHTWSLAAILEESQTYMFGFFFWILLFTMAWYTLGYQKQQKRLLEIEKKQIELELNFLKHQINPHFLFNTLNNIYGLALKHAPEAPESILKLSSILRYLLYDSNTSSASFEKEKEIIQAYIDLETLRVRDKLHLALTIEADKSYELPPLLWLPALENMFKHGTRHIADKYEAVFDYLVKDNVLTIHSKNSYKPIVNKEYGNIGLTNLRKRLELLYKDRYTISEEKNADTYELTMKINL